MGGLLDYQYMGDTRNEGPILVPSNHFSQILGAVIQFLPKRGPLF